MKLEFSPSGVAFIALILCVCLVLVSCFRSSFVREEPRSEPVEAQIAAFGVEAERVDLDELWARTRAFVDDPTRPADARLKQLELFSLLAPREFVHVDEVAARLDALEVEVSRARWRSNVVGWASEEVGRGVVGARGRAFDAGSAKTGVEGLLGVYLDESWMGERAGLEPLTIRFLDGSTKTFEGVFSGATGSLRDVLHQVVKRVAAELVPPRARGLGWTQRYNVAINALLKPLNGAPVFSSRPARVERRGIAGILRLIKGLSADTPLLGTRAEVLVRRYGATIEEHLKVWHALDNRVGRAQALREYRGAVKKYAHLEDGYNEELLGWYERFPSSHHLDEGTGLEGYRLAVIAGFWLRRLDDGSAPMVVEALEHLAEIGGTRGMRRPG